MKNAILIALALTTFSTFAGVKISKEEKQARKECKAEHKEFKTKKQIHECAKEKLSLAGQATK